MVTLGCYDIKFSFLLPDHSSLFTGSLSLLYALRVMMSTTVGFFGLVSLTNLHYEMAASLHVVIVVVQTDDIIHGKTLSQATSDEDVNKS